MITTNKGKVCCIIFCCTMNSIFAILIQDFKGSSAYLEGDILGADVQQGEQEEIQEEESMNTLKTHQSIQNQGNNCKLGLT